MFVNYSLQLSDTNFFLLILPNGTLKFIIFYYCFMFYGLHIFIYVDIVDCLLGEKQKSEFFNDIYNYFLIN